MSTSSCGKVAKYRVRVRRLESTQVSQLLLTRDSCFLGPRDIFRNPEAIWRQFEPTDGDAPFDLVLSHLDRSRLRKA